MSTTSSSDDGQSSPATGLDTAGTPRYVLSREYSTNSLVKYEWGGDVRILLAKIVILHAFLYRRISVKSSEGRDTSQTTSAEHGFLFVEQLSKNVFCPVTHDLLLQPHLTACCGNHLSQEAAMRIQEEGGACPLCIESHLSTV